MGSNWHTYSLGEIADIGSSKRIKMADYVSKGVPFFRSKEIIEKHKGNAISTELFITEEQFSLIEAKFGAPSTGDILLTSVGTLGVPYQVQSSDRFYFKDGNLTWFRNFKDAVNPRYLYFWLTSGVAKRKIDEVTIGSTQQALTIVALKSITIDLPPISIQSAIVKHIDSISRKITLNRQINQTLEQMAQTLFKSWFVDFDPVIDNALDAGNPIPDELQHRAEARKAVRESGGFNPLPDEVRQLFPDAFEESELGWVPKGWEAGNLSNVASYTSNRIATTELSLNNYVSTENMLVEKKGIVEAAKLPTVNTVPAYTTGNVLISNIRPYFKKIWMANGDGGHSNDVLGFVVKAPNTESYMFNLLYQDALFDFMMTTSKGSKMPRGDKKAIMAWPVVIPPYDLREYFSKRVGDFYVASSAKVEENKTLTQLRDTLLPKLISGELRIDDVEAIIEQETVSA